MISKLPPILLALSAVIFAALVTVVTFVLISQEGRDNYFLFRTLGNLLLTLATFANLASFLFVYRKKHENETPYTAIWPGMTILTWRCLAIAALFHVIAWFAKDTTWVQILDIIVLFIILGAWLIMAAFFFLSGSSEAGKAHHTRAQSFK